MELQKLIENLENTLEKNGYTLEDLKQELCDCGNEEGGSYEHGESKEEKQLSSYDDRLEQILEIEDKKEKIRELKRLLQELKSRYKGTNPSKQIKDFYNRVKKLLEAEERGKNKTSNNMIR